MSTAPLTPPPERTPAIVLGEVGTQASGFSWPWVQWFQQIQQMVNRALAGTATFVDNETVVGSGTAWGLNYPPIAGSLMLFTSAGAALLSPADYTVVGTAITTTSSQSALRAWYRR